MTQTLLHTRAAALLVAVLLVLTALTGVAAADSRAGPTIVVPAGETVTGGLSAVGGTITVYGTVRGDLQAAGGTVLVADGATVTGNVQATGGDVRIDGTVDGDVAVASGNAVIGPNATIHGSLSVGAGSALVAGTVDGDATIGADTVTLAATATVGGDLVYDGTLTRESGSQVAGSIRQDSNPAGPATLVVPGIPSWVGVSYGFLVNLVVGAVLLTAFPRFSRNVADRVVDTPIRSAGWGLLVLLGTPVLFVFVAITIIGIPLALAGLLTFALLLWVAAAYGQYALGAWLLSFTDWERRYLALVVGALVVAAVQFVPLLNALVGAVLLILALGALATALVAVYRNRAAESEPSDGPVA